MAKRDGRKLVHAAAARKETHDIIRTCEAIEDRKFNPFLLDVKYALGVLKKYFPDWKELEDHCLDANALNHLSRVLRLQGSQLRFQSSSLYADPAFLEEKLPTLSARHLAQILVESWHPIIELEQITEQSMAEAIAYWNALAPIDERWRRLDIGEYAEPTSLETNQLNEIGLKAKESFDEELMNLWRQLRVESLHGAVDYRGFVCRDSFPETVERAFLVSFLVTYGYARMAKSKGSMLLFPNEERRIEKRPVSLPISITREVWVKWKEEVKPSGSTETK